MKKALLIGNQEYKNMGKLNLPQNDVNTFKDILESIGFLVTYHFDVTYEVMRKCILDFSNSISNGDEIVFYFSGHGYSFESHNYITPIDCSDDSTISKLDILVKGYENSVKAIDVDLITNNLKKNSDGINIVLLDACREIYEKEMYNERKIGDLIEPPKQSDNVFLSYATRLGEKADDGVYMEAISKFIYRKFQTLDDLFYCVSDYVMNNSKGQMPSVNKIITKSYSFINEVNYCIQVEKQHYEELFEIYEVIYNELINKNISPYYLKQQIHDSIKGTIYYPYKLLDNYVKQVITALEEKLGIIYLLLEDEHFTRIDVHEDIIFIESKFSGGYRFENNDYYEFNKCLEFIKTLHCESEGIYNYKNKTILVFSQSYFQIILCDKEATLTELVCNPIKKIVKNNTSIYIENMINSRAICIKNLIIEYIKNKKNVLIVGSPKTNKEELVSAFTEYFSVRDKILILNDDKKILTHKGQLCESSTDFECLANKDTNQLEEYNMLVNSKNINRLIYQKKAFRRNENIFKMINNIQCEQFIATYDYNKDIFIDIINNSCNDTTILNAELIVILNNVYKIGSFVNYIYEKNRDKFECTAKIEIDYKKLDLLIEKKH
ncbi:caspase family protein [Clostridium sp. YIM B02569]|uniref:caspase family protein n=1 Tax=Clostridium sp. YIM B02569 TaxID=2911967 RepID=UPI001EEB243F|nr:caspase family protein [Clostridium sp. YIM B02569]